MSLNRRKFLGLSGSCIAMISAFGPESLQAQKANQQLSMVDLTQKHLKEGFWSADSLFLSAIKFLRQPEEIVRVAAGFGGGMHQKDLCGYLTGGIMSIGLFAGPSRGNDKESRQKCRRLTKEYYEWWAKNYPLHCKDIGSPCNYKEMGNKSSEFLQKLFERESAD